MALIIFFEKLWKTLKKLKKLNLSPQNSRYDVLHLLYSACAFTPPPLLWKMVGFLMVSVWNKTDIWAFISHKRTGKIRLENNNKCRNLERLKWRPFFFIPHSFGVPAAAASTKTTACTKLMFVSYKTRLKLTILFNWLFQNNIQASVDLLKFAQQFLILNNLARISHYSNGIISWILEWSVT